MSRTERRRSRSGSSSPARVMLSLGTYAGGWRIMRTLGRKIIELDPPQGFAAETTGASIMYAHGVHLPGADLHDACHHLGDHGRGRDEAGERGALGRREEHRPGLVHHDAGCGAGRGASYWLVGWSSADAGRSARYRRVRRGLALTHRHDMMGPPPGSRGRALRLAVAPPCSTARRLSRVSRSGRRCSPRWPGPTGWRRSARCRRSR